MVTISPAIDRASDTARDQLERFVAADRARLDDVVVDAVAEIRVPIALLERLR
jgi:hypothetical protein